MASLLALALGAGAAHAQVNAYVVSQGNSSLLVIDTATNTVTATVTGLAIPRAITPSPGGDLVYVTSFNGISAIDTATNTVTATVTTGNNPVGIAVTPDNAFAYVANNASATVSVIDLATYTVIATLPGITNSSIAITPDGTSVWVGVGSLSGATIAVIDTATNTVSTTFPTGHGVNGAFSMVFTADGALAYVVNSDNTVSAIDSTTHAVVANIPVGSLAFYIDLTPDGAYAYVANLLGNSVSVIDTATNTVVATVPVGAFPRALAFTPDGAFAYVTNFNDNTISVIDTATQTVVTTFAVGLRPWGIAILRLPNVAPDLASDQASVTVNEGEAAANTGTVSDGNGDNVSLSASVGTVVNNGDGTWSWSFLTSDGPAESQTVTITGDDGNGGVTSTSFDLVVDNVAPTITSVTNDGPVVAGGTATITVAATDPAGANDPLSYEFDCDDNGTFEVGPQAGNSTVCGFGTAGNATVNVRVTDGDGGTATGSTVVTVLFPPPNCSNATASPNLLWPPNHKFVAVQISGIVNPAPGAVTISVTSIFQDEPVQSSGSGNTSPDATGVGTANPSVRAERDGGNDGRVYHIAFTATGASGSCTGTVTVGVAKSQGNNGGPVDQGALFDSTLP